MSVLRLATIVIAAMAVVLMARDFCPKLRFWSLYQSFECGGVGRPCEINGRQYSVLAPKGAGPFPAVLFFHGSGGTGDKTIQNIPLVQPFLERGYAFIAPTALEISYRNGPGTGWVWNAAHYEWDDFGFSSDVIEDAVTRFPIDPDRIVVAGHSRGGTFAWYLACSNVDTRFHAFAPVNGTTVRNRPGPCAEASFGFDVLYTHGYVDAVIPFAGSGPEAGWPGYLGAVEIIDSVAYLSGCTSIDVVEHGEVVQRTWSDCSGDASVSLIGFNGGHGVPQGWADLMLDWFGGLTLAER